MTGPCRAGRAPAFFTVATTSCAGTDHFRDRKLSGLARSRPVLMIVTGAPVKSVLVRPA